MFNRRSRQFKCKGSDALTNPCDVNCEGSRLPGQAIQNLNFLRLLPVLIGNKVQDPEDDVWQLMMQLKDIVDLICAQNISLPQVAYVDIQEYLESFGIFGIIIQEYLESRKSLFG